MTTKIGKLSQRFCGLQKHHHWSLEFFKILFLNNSCSYITHHSPVNNVSSPACHAGDPGSSPSLAREDTLCPFKFNNFLSSTPRLDCLQHLITNKKKSFGFIKPANMFARFLHSFPLSAPQKNGQCNASSEIKHHHHPHYGIRWHHSR